MVKGLHHVALRCTGLENYQETLDFYLNIIGMKLRYSWGEGLNAASMLELNGGVLEIFAQGRAAGDIGAVNHFCFATDDPVSAAVKVAEAGYPVLVPPTEVRLDLTAPSRSELKLVYSYCMGPVGEVIEFYKEEDEE